MDQKASSTTLKNVSQCWTWTPNRSNDEDKTGKNCDGFTSESRLMLDIERAKEAVSAETAVLSRKALRLLSSTAARQDALRERLGLSAAQPSPPELYTSAKQALPGQRAQISLDSLDKKSNDSFWEQVLLGSQKTIQTCKELHMADRDQSPTTSIRSGSKLSSIDCHTPNELRTISLIGSPVQDFKPALHIPQAIPLSRSRISRLPVLSNKLRRSEDKYMADGCRLQTAQNVVEALIHTVERFQLKSIASPGVSKTTNATPVRTLFVQRAPIVPQTKRRKSRPAMLLRPAKSKELQALINPVESLSISFKLLSSDDWVKKIEGLTLLQTLAQHHSETLKTKLHEACLVLIEGVNNQRSAVACAAINTLAELFVYLQKVMDPEVEATGRSLLLKLAQTSNVFINLQANEALDAMVQNCSPARSLRALNTGLKHLCASVRGSTAQHLRLLADRLGASHIMAAGRTFTELFLTAVAKLSLDAAPDVRHHGHSILHELALHKDFLKLWTKIIPDREKCPLDKILRKAK